MARSWSFGVAAGRYDALRPRYPTAVFDALERALGALRGAYVVEVGAGTGIATTALLERGAHVIAIEPDPQMRRLLVAKAPRAGVVPSKLEHVTLGDVDAVVGFQSLHWVGLEELWRFARRALRPGGLLVGVWQLVSLTHRDAAAAVQRILAEYGVTSIGGSDHLVQTTMARLGGDAHEDFEPASTVRVPWQSRSSASTFAGLLATMSDLLALGDAACTSCEQALRSALAPHEPLVIQYDCVVLLRRRTA